MILLKHCGHSCFAAVALAAAVFASSGFAQSTPPANDGALSAVRSLETVFQRAIDEAAPSVASIFLIGPPDEQQPRFRGDFGQIPRAERDKTNPDAYTFSPSAFGSGVVLDRQGSVLTCFHVVRPAAREPRIQIKIHYADGKRCDGVIYAADPRSDLAVIRPVGDAPTNAKPIAIADGAKLKRGQFVLAIGNPFGVAASDGATSASWGIVSNIRRRPALPPDLDENVDDAPMYLYRTLIQTDARLNTGISGGALIDIEGRLVGITVALSAATGLETPGGFAIPTDKLTRRIMDTLAQGREVEYGFLGIQPKAVAINVGPNDRGGILVDNIVPYVPAFRAGLHDGDVIVEIDGTRIRDLSDLMLVVGSLPVSTVMRAKVIRNKEELTLQIPLAKYPLKSEPIFTQKRPAWNGIRVDHLSVLASTRGVWGLDRERITEGVAIRDVVGGSPADQMGIREKQVIIRVAGKLVFSPDEFDREIAKAKYPVKIELQSDRERVEHTFQDPQNKPPVETKKK